jgi:hypothetical protein
MTDDRPYKVFSPTKIWMSPTARAWAKEHGMSERDFGKYLIARHQESGDPFASDVGGHPPGRSEIRGFESDPQDAFAGDVGQHPPGMPTEGFTPQVLADAASDLADPFRGDVAESPPGLNEIIEGFRPEPQRQRIHDAEAYWGTKW